MWLAKIALQRPYTFVVLALLILLLGVFTTLRIPIDIFPNINIPVVAAIWSYTGLSPDDMAKRIVLLTEKAAQRITTGRDFGTSLEVLAGLSASEDVIANPPDSLATGALVRIVQPQSNPSPTAPPTARQMTPAGSGQS
jgi:AcrB/AcrD/AcrF family